jgi:hypothetical protein
LTLTVIRTRSFACAMAAICPSVNGIVVVFERVHGAYPWRNVGTHTSAHARPVPRWRSRDRCSSHSISVTQRPRSVPIPVDVRPRCDKLQE